MANKSTIDCVIVGYNSLAFSQIETGLRKFKNYSGGFRKLQTETVPYNGNRMDYMSLLNSVLKNTTGIDPQFSVFDLPNLAVLHLESFLRLHHLRAETINFFNHEKDRFLEFLCQRPTAVVITTTFYYECTPIVEIVDFVRCHSPSTVVIIGGPHIYNMLDFTEQDVTNSYLRKLGGDIYVYDSQGESTLTKVLLQLKSNSPNFATIPNLLYRDTKKSFCKTARRPEDNDLNIYHVDWSNFFRTNLSAPVVQLRTARSCAFKCSFCRYPVLAGPLRLKSLEILEVELKLIDDANAKYIVFIDDTFNVPLKRFKDICRIFIRKKFRIRWFSYFRCSHADNETYDLMEQSGCLGVFLGLESGDQKILNRMNKTASLDHYRTGIKQLKDRGIITFASLIIGFPGETPLTVTNTMSFLECSAPDFYRTELFYCDTKVPMYANSEQYGLIGKGYNWQHATMDWQEACYWVETIYGNVTNSTVLPGYNFDFWAIPYLLGKGITIEKIKRFTERAQRLMLLGLGEGSFGTEEKHLEDVFLE